jgi:2-C-methyl-D-erythritol 4-phosphate cytidylyltransferase/2-C-methyl-D-erythritol 2,4-cyclodiphosphate synthase
MYLCGVEIEAEFGFGAHSDGDVALHALTDAILGAAGMGDIGEHFPDSDSRYAGADSALLLEEAVSKIRRYGLDIYSCDITIVAEVPRLSPYKREMRRRVADILAIGVQRVNIKATTSEGMGFIGRGEGVSVYAVATIGYFDWTKGESR